LKLHLVVPALLLIAGGVSLTWALRGAFERPVVPDTPDTPATVSAVGEATLGCGYRGGHSVDFSFPVAQTGLRDTSQFQDRRLYLKIQGSLQEAAGKWVIDPGRDVDAGVCNADNSKCAHATSGVAHIIRASNDVLEGQFSLVLDTGQSINETFRARVTSSVAASMCK
jgi:hypothetical protein